ncbi:MAG: hypothetical protein RL689_2006 [Planctomycetota bacterium]|jgi:hypothetical protein
MSFRHFIVAGKPLQGSLATGPGEPASGMRRWSIAAAVVVIVGALSGGLAGCGASPDDKAAQTPEGPAYASPWDKPFVPRHQRAAKDAAAAAPPPKSRSLAELMQLGDADAPAPASPSPLEVPDAPVAVPPVAAAGREPGPAMLPVGSKDWTIVIAGFDKVTEVPLANAALARVRAQPGLEAAFLEERGKAVVVAYGKYPSLDAPAARADLERIRGLAVEGGTPFAGAMLAPPVFDALPGTIPEYDLRNAKAQAGAERAAYTLQVGVYCRLDDQEPSPKELAEFRKAAEKAAVEMRRQGETAFYFHGPRRSMVTVGLFGVDDYDLRQSRLRSPAIAKLMERFPHNLVNGAGVKRKRSGQAEAVMDPSFVVAVP